MAIQLMPFITLILRVNVKQKISAEGWQYLMHYSQPQKNFDGELIVFGAMNGQDIDNDIKNLTSFGFVGPDKGEKSDMVVWESIFEAVTYVPSWLSVVDVKFFDEEKPDVRAWKLTDSGVYRLVDFSNRAELPMKGYECDWAPLIGKIS